MKKEKKVRTYQRRTKSGKTVTVRAHTASYEAAEKAKEAAKKKGAGDELSDRKSKKDESWKLPMDEFLKKLKDDNAKKKWNEEIDKSWESDEKPKKKTIKKSEKEPDKKSTKKRSVGTGTNGPEPKKKETKKTTAKKTAETSEPAFTAAEFKEWYRGTGSAADKKVAKALRKQLGRSGYRKFEDEAIDNYTSRGHLKMFKRVSGGGESSAPTKTAKSSVKVTSTSLSAKDINDTSKTSRKSSTKSLAKRWDSTPPNDIMDAKARKTEAPSKSITSTKNIDAELKKIGLKMHRTSTGGIEIYKAGDRVSMKNLVAGVHYNGDYISFGGKNEKENKAKYSSALSKLFTKPKETKRTISSVDRD